MPSFFQLYVWLKSSGGRNWNKFQLLKKWHKCSTFRRVQGASQIFFIKCGPRVGFSRPRGRVFLYFWCQACPCKVEYKPAHTCKQKYVPPGLAHAHTHHMALPPERHKFKHRFLLKIEYKIRKQMQTPKVHDFSHKLEQLRCAEIGTQIRRQIDVHKFTLPMQSTPGPWSVFLEHFGIVGIWHLALGFPKNCQKNAQNWLVHHRSLEWLIRTIPQLLMDQKKHTHIPDVSISCRSVSLKPHVRLLMASKSPKRNQVLASQNFLKRFHARRGVLNTVVETVD